MVARQINGLWRLNFRRTLATLEPIKDWSMTMPREKLIKIGAKVVG